MHEIPDIFLGCTVDAGSEPMYVTPLGGQPTGKAAPPILNLAYLASRDVLRWAGVYARSPGQCSGMVVFYTLCYPRI